MKKVAGGIKDSRGCRHDWNKILDGNQWELKRGEDFRSNVGSFRNQVYAAAIRRGKRVSVAVVDDNTIRIQARDGE